MRTTKVGVAPGRSRSTTTNRRSNCEPTGYMRLLLRRGQVLEELLTLEGEEATRHMNRHDKAQPAKFMGSTVQYDGSDDSTKGRCHGSHHSTGNPMYLKFKLCSVQKACGNP